MGRHSAPQDDEVADPGPPGRRDRGGGTHADLQMLRENPALRVRCIAAAVAPFALYTVVLVVLRQVDAFVLWVWVPIVVAGILVGAMLDLGQRSDRNKPSDG